MKCRRTRPRKLLVTTTQREIRA